MLVYLPASPGWIKASSPKATSLIDRKWKVAKEMVGRRLSQAEAKKLLAKFG
jgi:hypothetical protein